MMKPMRHSRRIAEHRLGFTLVELMVSMAIIAVLATISAAIFRTTLDTRELAAQRIEVNEVARTLLDLMVEEMRASYLSPDSVAPVVEGSGEATGREFRFRFAGLRHDHSYKSLGGDGPGAGKDDDEDGKVDEEELDGIDNDGDDLVDEDIGEFPDDLVHFVRLVDTDSGKLALEEVSYGLNERGTQLMRRGRRADPEENYPVGGFVESGNSILPRVVTTADRDGNPKPQTGAIPARPAWRGWDTLTSEDQDFGTSSSNLATLAYDVRGLRFTYWYYDYNAGGYRRALEWDSARETAYLLPAAGGAAGGQTIFTQQAASTAWTDPTDPNFFRDSISSICNEWDDRYRFLVSSPAQLFAGASGDSQEISNLARQIGEHTDGLPVFVEITLYVQDRDQAKTPTPYTARVFLPNQNIGS